MAPFFVAAGTRYEVSLQPLSGAVLPPLALHAVRVGLESAPPDATPDPMAFANRVRASPVLASRIDEPADLAVVETRPSGGRAGARQPASTAAAKARRPSSHVVLLATATVIAEGVRQTDLAAAKNMGARIVEEGFDGKVLFRVDTVARAFDLVELLLSREVGAVSPNFLRRIIRPRASRPTAPWAQAKIGVSAAWAITKGNPDVRVAVLDEGVDTAHPALRPAVVAERDFIGGKGNSAMPDGNDAHGTACAGIIVSRDAALPGIAPRCSLIAARIAMDDGTGQQWVFDDFATADAIDWSWRQGAAVLSNSWGGGAPSDSISRAFGRARTQGRNGLGAVVAIAAGNGQLPIDFPGDLPGYVTVGASTPRDERKTKTSSDGENWWGSNFGPTLSLLAPGVFISTTDISGPSGYDPGDFTKTFNGTSSATPHVAGAAALMLSANPGLSAPTVRTMLGQTAKTIAGQTGWTPELGFGRLDVARAVSVSKAALTPGKRPAARRRTPRPKKKARRR